MSQIPALTLGLVLMLPTGIASAQDADAGDGGTSRATFDGEICKVDGLTPAQCDCAWKFVSGKLSASDLKLAMLLTASSSDDVEIAKKADAVLDKSKPSEKRQDALSSEISALVIEAEDACVK
jgi:hypothetical protein